MASIKLNYKGEYRRILLSSSKLTLTELQNKAVQIFPSLVGQTLFFSWIDEDDDIIKFSSDEELQDALHYHLKDGKGVLKFDITTGDRCSTGTTNINSSNNNNTSNRSQSEAKPIHANVMCDECGASPITGIRYKCAVRDNFDLCENCEAANIQPYPMIKIYTPDQAPYAILIAIRDDEQGPHHPPHHHPPHGRHHGRHHGRPHGPPPHGPPPHGHPFGGRFGGLFGGGPFGGRGCPPPHHRMEKWARKFCPGFADSTEHSTSGSSCANSAPVPTTATPTATAVDADVCIANVNAGCCPRFNSSSSSSSSANDAADIEQKIIDEVIRLSVEENNAKNVNVTSASASASASVTEKPKARFVKDVTFPDGTTVQPGTHFMKIWRIRNDGTTDWSNDNVLVAAGGDELSSFDVRIPLPSIPAGQEADVAIELVAPERSGRHVAYFRLQTADGTSFGHRLWADVRVVEDIASSLDWQVVNEMLNSSENTGSISQQSLEQDDISGSLSSSTSVPISLSGDLPTSSHSPISLSNETILPPTAVVGVLVNDTNSTTSSGSGGAATSTATVTATPASTDMATDIWCRVYETELKVLRDMGFTDVSVIIPLLREHVTMPVSRNPDLQGQPSATGMQRVVIQLLGSSMTL